MMQKCCISKFCRWPFDTFEDSSSRTLERMSLIPFNIFSMSQKSSRTRNVLPRVNNINMFVHGMSVCCRVLEHFTTTGSIIRNYYYHHHHRHHRLFLTLLILVSKFQNCSNNARKIMVDGKGRKFNFLVLLIPLAFEKRKLKNNRFLATD